MFGINLNFWLIIGFLAQGMFASRFLVQWIASERQRKSVIPIQFWFLSLIGGFMLLMYAIYRKDPVFILGQSTGVIIYSRNLMLIYHRKRKLKKLKSREQDKKEAVSSNNISDSQNSLNPRSNESS